MPIGLFLCRLNISHKNFKTGMDNFSSIYGIMVCISGISLNRSKMSSLTGIFFVCDMHLIEYSNH